MAIPTSLLHKLCCTTCAKCIDKIAHKYIICPTCKGTRHLNCTSLHIVDNDVICPVCLAHLLPFNNITSDVEFYAALSGRKDTHNIDYSQLDIIKLELEHDFSSGSLTNNDDLDADSNHYNIFFSQSANYCETSDLNKTTPLPKGGFPQFLLHINARSLNKNLSNLTTELNLLINKPSIIAVTETWAATDNDNLVIPGYSAIHKARKTKPGGGVALYLQDQIELSYKLRPDLSSDDLSESLFIQVAIKKRKDMIIGVIYKPPDSDVDKYTANIELLLKKLTKESRPCFLLGDYNINLLKHTNHSPTKHFLDTILAYGFYPLINKPTRITTYSTTLIDNILTNIHDTELKPIIWTVDISDHLPVSVILLADSKSNKSNIKRTITKRDFSTKNLNKFKDDLRNYDWSVLDNTSNTNTMYTLFTSIVQNIYNSAFPIHNKTLRLDECHKPWITSAIKKSIKHKNSLYRLFLTNRTHQAETTYKSYRNKLTTILRKSERMYYIKKLENVKDNLLKTWKVLNRIIARKSNDNSNISEITYNNQTLTDKNDIVDKFNTFFANVGPDLASKIPASKDSFKNYLKSPNKNSIFLEPTDQHEVKQIICLLKNSNSKRHDGLSTVTIKNCSDELARPLSMVFNRSMNDGIVPDDLKIAKVIPIYKAGDKRNITNYRPISVLPTFSKILERLLYNRMINFLNKHEILSQSQYGFRKKLSTSMALLDLVDKLTNSIENNEYTIGIFIDLAKAFDTVNHKILLDKLYHYGIRGIPHSWFKSYLANRYQYVQLDNTHSIHHSVICGVPQGSILGPLLFLLYINDISTVTKLLTFIMFADDTNMFISGKDLTHITSVLNTELKVVNSWFSTNLLSLNIKKTNYILFGNRSAPDITILLNNQIITRVHETKFLGVIIQANLKWNQHVNLLTNTISKTIGIMRKAKFLLTTAHLRIIYRSLVEPYLNYCCIIWASANKSILLEQIHKLQKRVVRIITYSDYRAHTKPLFCKLGLLNIYDIYKTQTLVFVYKSKNFLLPAQYNNYFTDIKKVHSYATRSSTSKLHIHKAKKLCRINTLIIQGPKHWNSLPELIRSATSLALFKTKLNLMLTSSYLNN
jgi:hypothetical protein